MSQGIQDPQNLPITDEDLARLEVEPHLIPFIVSTTQRAEQSSSGEPQLTPTEAENLVEVLDRVVLSNTVNPGLKNRCFKVLRKVLPAHMILPKSYLLADVTLSDDRPYALGEFADIRIGRLDGHQVRVKEFRTQGVPDVDRIKRRFYRDIIGWKYIMHPNVVPFYGVLEMSSSSCIINPWLPNGNILEYIHKNQRLAQAACGLEYLHSLGVVHSNVNPRNILIDEDGSARLGDFGIMAIITDPSIVDPEMETELSRPDFRIRYMAPELLNPSQFHLRNSNPTKESDIYSLALTVYEVLTGILPYGNARDGIIIFQVVTGDRPPRPQNTQWLRDQIWDMITKCWSEQREQRLDIRSVYNQLSVSSIQEIAEGQRGVQTTAPSPDIVEDPRPPSPPPPRQDVAGGLSSIFVEEGVPRDSPNNSTQRKAGKKLVKRERSVPPQTVPFLSALKAAKKRFSSPASTVNHVGRVEIRESQRTGSRGITRAALHGPPPSADRHDPGEQRDKPNETIHRMQPRQHIGNMALPGQDLEEDLPEMNDHPTRSPFQNRRASPTRTKEVVEVLSNSDLPPPEPSIYNLDAGSSLSVLSFGGSVEIPAVLTPSGAMNAEINTKFQDPPTQEFIDRLDMILDRARRDQERHELLNILCKMCSRQRVLPKSMHVGRLTGELVEAERGGHATIFRAQHNNRQVAAKTIRVTMSSNFDRCRSEFCREAVAWRHLRHPNILPLLGVDLEEHRLSMISEWMDEGNINEYVEGHRGANRLQLLADAATGLEYMHSLNMVHGDLKGANILVNQSHRACLADFGLSTIASVEHNAAANASLISVTSKASLMSFTAGGTPRWMSPELFDPERFGANDDRPTKESDCYALGMVVYEVLSGNTPFWGIMNEWLLIYAIMEGYRPKKPDAAESLGITNELWEMVQRCWLPDASARPDVETISSHLDPWLWDRRPSM